MKHKFILINPLLLHNDDLVYDENLKDIRHEFNIMTSIMLRNRSTIQKQDLLMRLVMILGRPQKFILFVEVGLLAVKVFCCCKSKLEKSK